MSLSEEERRRIYEEEKARDEARIQINAKGLGIGCLGLIALTIIFGTCFAVLSSVGSGYVGGLSGCVNFKRLYFNLDEGVFTDEELREQVRKIRDRTSTAEPAIAYASTAMLRAVTQRDVAGFFGSIEVMADACADADYIRLSPDQRFTRTKSRSASSGPRPATNRTVVHQGHDDEKLDTSPPSMPTPIIAPMTVTTDLAGTPRSTPTRTPKPTGRIVFASARDGRASIYVMNADGTNQVNLTDASGGDYWPTWSPDGSKIAFMSNRDDSRYGTFDIYVMNADGSGVARLSNIEGDNLTGEVPAWSPDGTRIAFASNLEDNRSEIYVINVDGSGLTRLTNDPRLPWKSSPSWSPDGTKIAFTDGSSGKDEIYLMDIDGSNFVNLTNDPGNDRFPSWSPDGTKIAFESDRSSHMGIYVMNADGSNQVYLTHGLGDYARFPAWSPDGSHIVFTAAFKRTRQEIYVMNADGSDKTKLTNNTATDYQPSWARDGAD